MVSAASGLGCRWNDRPARVSQGGELSQALISFTDARNFWKYNRADAFIRLVQAAGHSPGWTDAYGYALVASGRAEAMLDPVAAPWDCSPFPAIFREAGGYFGDWRNNETIYAGEALGCNRALLPALLEILNA
jgi:myo-inositol-1(or 4)-monophosphatase